MNQAPTLPSPDRPNSPATHRRCACSRLLEVLAGSDRRQSLQSLVEETGLPKPTLHRMLQQLESAGMLLRDSDGRHYGTGPRLRRLAENLLLNDTHHGARHAVLRQLVRGGRRELQHHRLVGQRGGLPGPGRDRRAAALLPARRLARAGALLGQRQGVAGADVAGPAPAPAGACAAGALHGQHPGRPRRAGGRARAGAQGRLRAGRRGVPARPAVHRGARAARRRRRPTCVSRSRRRSCACPPTRRASGCRRCSAPPARWPISTPKPRVPPESTPP